MDFTRNVARSFTLGEFFVTNSAGGKAGLYEDLMALPEAKRNAIVANIKALAPRLQEIRNHFGRPIIITSGWRSQRVNRLVGGASRSQHLTGKAADIVVVGVSPREVQRYLDPHWKGGLGYGRTFTHLDIRPWRARFNY